MYNIAIPKVLGVSTYDRNGLLHELEACGATRVFLAISALSYDKAERRECFDNLKKEIEFFKGKGLEVGVWFWAFWVNGEHHLTPVKGFAGKESSMEVCPLDPEFLDFAVENITEIASYNPDLIMFDDDLRLGHFDSGYGCTCKHHLKTMSDILGEEVCHEGLFDKCFSGGRNKYRSAYLKASGDSLRSFCKTMRDALDKVNPKIRLGACSCITVWDGDGVDSYELAKIMAGSTKPFVRLIGAPYWGALKNWGHRIENVVEFERLETSWCNDDSIEIFTEGDVYPRPRTRIPAAYLEIFDSALRFAGGTDGILKYMLDYTSKLEYEKGYVIRHLDNKSKYDYIEKIAPGKENAGIRVYDLLHKLEDADFSDRSVTPEYIQDLVFNRGGRFLSEISVPTVYKGQGCAGLAVGDNAINLPDEAFEKPLILDLRAASILEKKGVDTGLASAGELFAPSMEVFPDGEHIPIAPSSKCSGLVTVKDGAKVISDFENDGTSVPSAYTYKNAKGNNFLVLNFIADVVAEPIRRNYRRARQICDFVEACGEKMPVKCFDNPDLYIICKKNENGMALGLWNCFEDYCLSTRLVLDKEYSHVEFEGCTGRLCKNELIIDRINAFEFCFVSLS